MKHLKCIYKDDWLNRHAWIKKNKSLVICAYYMALSLKYPLWSIIIWNSLWWIIDTGWIILIVILRTLCMKIIIVTIILFILMLISNLYLRTLNVLIYIFLLFFIIKVILNILFILISFHISKFTSCFD
jgi:hypothetical protein